MHIARALKLAALSVIICLLTACSVTTGNDSLYRCKQLERCNLPEELVQGMGLVYIIRRYSFINASERHYLHVNESPGKQNKYIGYLTAGTYCALHTQSKSITLITNEGKNEERINVNIEPGKKHYIHLDTQNTLTGFKLKYDLKQIGESEGEKYLMKDVYSMCRK
jgi:hypothetical protein